MSKTTNPTPHTRKRRQGQHMSEAERKSVQDAFLQTFSVTANVRAACMKVGIDRSTVYSWQEHDTEFSLRFKQAELDANDLIRAELFRRGVQGYEKPLVSMGRAIFDSDGKPLTERVYSDNLLSLLAKSRMPEFREKQQLEVTNTASKDIQAIHEAIARALAPYPEARYAVAQALAEMEQARGSV